MEVKKSANKATIFLSKSAAWTGRAGRVNWIFSRGDRTVE